MKKKVTMWGVMVLYGSLKEAWKQETRKMSNSNKDEVIFIKQNKVKQYNFKENI